MKKTNQTVLPIFYILYSVFTVLTWVILLRDRFTAEIISTKFYPQLASFLAQTEKLKLNTWPTLIFLVVLGLLFFLYFRQLKVILARPESLSSKKIILVSVLFQVIVFFSYPILSTDVLSYILSDRVSVVYHQNVWTTKPNVYTQDPYYYLVYPIYKDRDWTNQTRIYGGVNQFFYSWPTAISGNDLLTNLASHKLVVLFFNISTIFLVYFILKKYFPDKLQTGLIMVFWNPLFTIETVGSGHNDILMLFFLLLSYLFILRKNFLIAGVALALSTQVKSTSFLFAIFIVLYLISQTQWKNLIKLLFSYTFIVLGIYRLMGINPIITITRTAYSTSALWQSLSSLIPWAKPILNVTLLFFLTLQSLRQLIFRDNPIKIYCQTLLIYLLFFLGAFWNWYPIWLLVLTPFLENVLLKKAILAFTFTAILTYPVLWFSQRFNYQFSLWPVIIYLVMVSGPIVIYIKNFIDGHFGEHSDSKIY